MSVKTQFSIKDLENLSGVKAHTIRIWEKRYKLLEPDRTDTNIRQYDMSNMKKLLNVTFLYKEGYKISKIAKLEAAEIAGLVEELGSSSSESFALQSFKTAMFEFDHALFRSTYNDLLKKRSMNDIFYDVFLPLLNDIGTLWQTGTIDPIHERFISELIKQKIILHIHEIREKQTAYQPPKFALYLPYEEIHEIGLLFANYLILSQGFHTIYLGNNIPVESLKHILKHYNEITFLSYFTVKPDHQSVRGYVAQYQKEIGDLKAYPLWLMGSKIQKIDPRSLPAEVKIIFSLKELQTALSHLNS